MSSALVDAKVLIRFLTCDVPDRAEAARRLLERAVAGDIHLQVTALAFAEVVWVLEKVYHWSKPDIAARLAPLLGLAGVEVWEAPVLRQALAHYGSLNIDFIDAYQGEAALAEGATVIYSYDKDLDRIPGLERREP